MLASVIGRGGFLGSAVSVALNRFAIPEFIGKSKLSWPSENSSFQIELFKHSLDLYLDELGELQSGSRIAVFWCAGRTFPRSDHLEVELDRLLFDLVIGSLLKRFGGPNLHVIYASSAGGLYSDFSHGPFGPQSPVSPRTPYGLMKLAGEEHLRQPGRDAAPVEPGVRRGGRRPEDPGPVPPLRGRAVRRRVHLRCTVPRARYRRRAVRRGPLHRLLDVRHGVSLRRGRPAT